jgi:WD40 repeat protein
VEKILNESVMHEKFIKYKNYPEVRQRNHQESEKFLEFGGQLEALETNVKKKTKSTLEPLLSFNCQLTDNMQVTALDFNHRNPDLLLVGYRPRNSLKNDKRGMICFWTVKNSEFPERVIYTSSGVTAVKFSRSNPFIYGVGLMDGTVAIYNMKNPGDK